MASAITHAFITLPLGKAIFSQEMSWRFWAFSVFCSVIPDIDALGFYRGITYGSLFAHRGFTHSLFFAFFMSLAVVGLGFREDRPFSPARWKLWLFFFALACSHGALDALTGRGYGVAFFSPFDATRYSFPWAPIKISPLGLKSFLSSRGKEVLVNEIGWVWVPSLLLWAGVRGVRWMKSRPLPGPGRGEKRLDFSPRSRS
jgi:inner membrane protein